jgi:hypothetical protein
MIFQQFIIIVMIIIIIIIFVFIILLEYYYCINYHYSLLLLFIIIYYLWFIHSIHDYLFRLFSSFIPLNSFKFIQTFHSQLVPIYNWILILSAPSIQIITSNSFRNTVVLDSYRTRQTDRQTNRQRERDTAKKSGTEREDWISASCNIPIRIGYDTNTREYIG